MNALLYWRMFSTDNQTYRMNYEEQCTDNTSWISGGYTQSYYIWIMYKGKLICSIVYSPCLCPKIKRDSVCIGDSIAHHEDL